MTATRFMMIVATAGMLAACGGTSTQVRGDDVEVSRLAGKWAGEFEAQGASLRGAISFQLHAGRHLGEGTVQYAGGAGKARHIDVVQVGSDRIEGTLEPMTDPRCNCVLQTKFEGTLLGAVMAGTFETRSPDGAVQRQGNWSARRAD